MLWDTIMSAFKKLSEISEIHGISVRTLGKLITKHKIPRRMVYNREKKHYFIYAEYSQTLIDQINQINQTNKIKKREEFIMTDNDKLRKMNKYLTKIYKCVCF